MKRIFLLTLILAICIAPFAQAEPPSDKQIMEMVKLSGTLEALKPLLAQMSSNVSSSIKRMNPNLPAGAYTAADEEYKATMNVMVQEILTNQMLYYKKRLTAKEVDELIAIYSSPVWRKSVEISTQYLQNEMTPMLEKVVPKYTKDAMEHIIKRLKKNGYIDKDAGGA